MHYWLKVLLGGMVLEKIRQHSYMEDWLPFERRFAIITIFVTGIEKVLCIICSTALAISDQLNLKRVPIDIIHDFSWKDHSPQIRSLNVGMTVRMSTHRLRSHYIESVKLRPFCLVWYRRRPKLWPGWTYCLKKKNLSLNKCPQ